MIVRKRRKQSDIKASKKAVLAADNFDDLIDGADNDDGLADAIDDMADNIEDLQDAVDDIKEDKTKIEVINNIGDHFIAECEECGGIFISAVVDSDQVIDSVTGQCPLCGKQSDQYLKWIIRDVLAE